MIKNFKFDFSFFKKEIEKKNRRKLEKRKTGEWNLCNAYNALSTELKTAILIKLDENEIWGW